MSRKRYTPEQIISMLREAEVALSQGQSVDPGMSYAWCVRAELLPLAQRVRRASYRPGQAPQGAGEGEWPSPEGCLRSDLGQADPERGA